MHSCTPVIATVPEDHPVRVVALYGAVYLQVDPGRTVADEHRRSQRLYRSSAYPHRKAAHYHAAGCRGGRSGLAFGVGVHDQDRRLTTLCLTHFGCRGFPFRRRWYDRLVRCACPFESPPRFQAFLGTPKSFGRKRRGGVPNRFN